MPTPEHHRNGRSLHLSSCSREHHDNHYHNRIHNNHRNLNRHQHSNADRHHRLRRLHHLRRLRYQQRRQPRQWQPRDFPSIRGRWHCSNNQRDCRFRRHRVLHAMPAVHRLFGLRIVPGLDQMLSVFEWAVRWKSELRPIFPDECGLCSCKWLHDWERTVWAAIEWRKCVEKSQEKPCRYHKFMYGGLFWICRWWNEGRLQMIHLKLWEDFTRRFCYWTWNTQTHEQMVRYQSSFPVTSCTVDIGPLVCKDQRMHQRYISGSSSRRDLSASLWDLSISRVVRGGWTVSVGLGLLDPGFCRFRISDTRDIT